LTNNKNNMSIIESRALKYLTEEMGYSSEDIQYRYNKSPDFITSDNCGYEIKRKQGNCIYFHIDQLEKLKNKSNVDILVFDDEEDAPISIFPANIIEEGKIIDGLTIRTIKNKSGIRRRISNKKTRELRDAIKDDRFMNDLRKVSEDFSDVELEGWPKEWSIFLTNLDPPEQGKTRPVIVISEEAINQILPVVNALPITTRNTNKKIYPNEVSIPAFTGGLNKESIVLCYQIRTLDKKRLFKYIGKIDDIVIQEEIVDALCFQLGIIK